MKSAVISAYKDTGHVEENIRWLREKGYEVVIAADEPDDELLRIIEKYHVKATLSRKRRGKWRALNDALKLVSGEQIIFIDSDTVIKDLSGLNGSDAVEIVKEVRGKSIVERLVNVDYLVMTLGSAIAAKLGSCLGLNGSAFVIKRSVMDKLGGFRRKINEDTDLGVRLGLGGYSYDICGRAITEGPKTFKEWFKQRERWSMGGAEVLLENLLPILMHPRLWIPYLVFFYPALFGMLVSFLLPENYFTKFLYLVLPLLAILSPKLASLAILTLYELDTLRNLVAMGISFLAWSGIVLIFSKKIDFKIDVRVLPLYYFVYSPLWSAICLISFLRVLYCKIRGKRIEVNGWKL